MKVKLLILQSEFVEREREDVKEATVVFVVVVAF